MSEVRENTTIPAKTYERVVAHVCDICGRRTEQQWNLDPNWLRPRVSACNDFSTVIVRLEFGEHWPNGEGQTQSREYHICTPCFTDKLEPWLHAQGAKPTTKKVDY